MPDKSAKQDGSMVAKTITKEVAARLESNRCIGCGATLGDQHKPSCYRQGVVSTASLHTD